MNKKLKKITKPILFTNDVLLKVILRLKSQNYLTPIGPSFGKATGKAVYVSIVDVNVFVKAFTLFIRPLEVANATGFNGIAYTCLRCT